MHGTWFSRKKIYRYCFSSRVLTSSSKEELVFALHFWGGGVLRATQPPPIIFMYIFQSPYLLLILPAVHKRNLQNDGDETRLSTDERPRNDHFDFSTSDSPSPDHIDQQGMTKFLVVLSGCFHYSSKASLEARSGRQVNQRRHQETYIAQTKENPYLINFANK